MKCAARIWVAIAIVFALIAVYGTIAPAFSWPWTKWITKYDFDPQELSFKRYELLVAETRQITARQKAIAFSIFLSSMCLVLAIFAKQKGSSLNIPRRDG